jgi:hypothetical protein
MTYLKKKKNAKRKDQITNLEGWRNIPDSLKNSGSNRIHCFQLRDSDSNRIDCFRVRYSDWNRIDCFRVRYSDRNRIDCSRTHFRDRYRCCPDSSSSQNFLEENKLSIKSDKKRQNHLIIINLNWYELN